MEDQGATASGLAGVSAAVAKTAGNRFDCAKWMYNVREGNNDNKGRVVLRLPNIKRGFRVHGIALGLDFSDQDITIPISEDDVTEEGVELFIKTLYLKDVDLSPQEVLLVPEALKLLKHLPKDEKRRPVEVELLEKLDLSSGNAHILFDAVVDDEDPRHVDLRKKALDFVVQELPLSLHLGEEGEVELLQAEKMREAWSPNVWKALLDMHVNPNKDLKEEDLLFGLARWRDHAPFERHDKAVDLAKGGIRLKQIEPKLFVEGSKVCKTGLFTPYEVIHVVQALEKKKTWNFNDKKRQFGNDEEMSDSLLGGEGEGGGDDDYNDYEDASKRLSPISAATSRSRRRVRNNQANDKGSSSSAKRAKTVANPSTPLTSEDIQSLLDNLKDGETLTLPKGVFEIHTTLVLKNKRKVKITGHGRTEGHSTTLVGIQLESILVLEDCREVWISRLVFRSDTTASTPTTGILIQKNTKSTRLSALNFNNCSILDHSPSHDAPWPCDYDNIKFEGGTHGLILGTGSAGADVRNVVCEKVTNGVTIRGGKGHKLRVLDFTDVHNCLTIQGRKAEDNEVSDIRINSLPQEGGEADVVLVTLLGCKGNTVRDMGYACKVKGHGETHYLLKVGSLPEAKMSVAEGNTLQDAWVKGKVLIGVGSKDTKLINVDCHSPIKDEGEGTEELEYEDDTEESYKPKGT